MKDVHLKNAINKSQLELINNWQGEEEDRPSPEAWRRATDFLRNIGEWLEENEPEYQFFPPRILPGPHGSVDLHWKLSARKVEMLINFPASENELSDCFGTDSHGVQLKRKLDGDKEYIAIARWMRHA